MHNPAFLLLLPLILALLLALGEISGRSYAPTRGTARRRSVSSPASRTSRPTPSHRTVATWGSVRRTSLTPAGTRRTVGRYGLTPLTLQRTLWWPGKFTRPRVILSRRGRAGIEVKL